MKLKAHVCKNYPGATTFSPEILKSRTEASLDAYLENDSLCGMGDALLPARKSSGKHDAAFEVVVATPHHIVVTHEKIRLGVVSAILASEQGALPQSGYILHPTESFT
ncbi:MAG: hypothetical protein H7Y39_18630 [Nitrospiraceae bacterium]|nr:hypothetical protein [Nitrospiraceae bacterium]